MPPHHAPTLPPTKHQRIAIIGGGWAGMAAAVSAHQAGHHVTVFEAARNLGGRARHTDYQLPTGQTIRLDNGQHVLIGAYSECLRLMRLVGVVPETALLRLPLNLQLPNGQGLKFPDWPAPLDALAGIASAKGWTWRDKMGLLRHAIQWQRAHFKCPAHYSVAQLCQGLSPRVIAQLIQPLCISALNSLPEESSASLFLRVLQDAVLGAAKGSNLLIPRTDMGALFPTQAGQWLRAQGAQINIGQRITSLAHHPTQWHIQQQFFDHLILACPPYEAAKLIQTCDLNALQQRAHAQAKNPNSMDANAISTWLNQAKSLQFKAIATVYIQSKAQLKHPVLALNSNADYPAQFVFDQGQLQGATGLLAFVISTHTLARESLIQRVLLQAQNQLGLTDVQHLQTIIEKRATFVCSPNLQRPAMHIAPHLSACGDYVDGPYPATLEGAVRSGILAASCI